MEVITVVIPMKKPSPAPPSPSRARGQSARAVPLLHGWVLFRILFELKPVFSTLVLYDLLVDVFKFQQTNNQLLDRVGDFIYSIFQPDDELFFQPSSSRVWRENDNLFKGKMDICLSFGIGGYPGYPSFSEKPTESQLLILFDFATSSSNVTEPLTS
jgi:hypothetical protein